MEEIIEGVFHWKAIHPNTESEAGCHFVAGSGTAIDPLLPDEGIEWFDPHGVERIVLSTRHHLRHAPEIAERFGCPILCHESGLYEFEGGPNVEGFAFGDRLADDVVALEMDAISPDDTVLRIDQGGGALLFADSVVNRGSLGFVSDGLIGDDPEAVKAEILAHCKGLLDERFEHLLFATATRWSAAGARRCRPSPTAERASAHRSPGRGARAGRRGHMTCRSR